MDEFGYLAVILSIILGLSVTQLLQGLSNVINARDRVRIYWPAIAWALLLLVSIMKSVVIDGSLPGPFDLGFHLFWIAGATIAAATRSDLFHKVFVCVAGVSFIVYIGALFAELH